MSNGGFNGHLTDFLEDVRSILISYARRGQTITYEELSAEIEHRRGKPYPHYRWGSMLGRISHWERACGQPLLSAIVINRDGTVGPGFWKMVEDEMSIPVINRDEFLTATQRAVFTFWRLS